MDAKITDTPFRWWFLPSWLGLDAPCVVTTWTVAISLATETKINVYALGSLFLTVWSLYLLDRIYDVSKCTQWAFATGRMTFGRDYRWLYLTCLGLALLGLIALLLQLLPLAVMVRGLAVAGGMLIYWLAFVLPTPQRRLKGKELFVGIFFALGAMAVLGLSRETGPLLMAVASLVAFNCLVIAAREKESDAITDQSSSAQWWSTIERDLVWIGVICAIVAVLAGFVVSIGFALSLSTSLASLTVLHRRAKSFSADAVRAIADFCLLTPWVWFAVALP